MRFFLSAVAVVVIGCVIFLAFKSQTTEYVPAPDATVPQEVIGYLSSRMQTEGKGGPIVQDTLLQEVADNITFTAAAVSPSDFEAYKKAAGNAENDRIIRGFLTANHYTPQYTLQIWGFGDNPKDVASEMVLREPSRSAIGSHKWTRAGASSVVAASRTYYFVILATE